LKIFARKISGQFAPESGGQFSRFAHLQDGTRLSEAERNLLDLSHRQVLTDHNIDIIEIKGDWNERFEKAVEQINKLIATNGQKHRA
jgi:nicotinamide riboside kinase